MHFSFLFPADQYPLVCFTGALCRTRPAVVVAASPAVLHQIRFLSGDTAGFSRGARTFRAQPRSRRCEVNLTPGFMLQFKSWKEQETVRQGPTVWALCSFWAGSCDPAVPWHQIPTDPSCFPNPLLQCQALHFQVALPQAQVQTQAGTVTLQQLKI